MPWVPATELSYGLIWPKPRELALHERALFEHAAAVNRDIVLEVERTFGSSLLGSQNG